MPTFLLRVSDSQGDKLLKVDKEEFTIGRSTEAGVCIPHRSVSKKHLRIERKGGRYVFRDLESRNGVTLNGFPTKRGAVVDGDELQLGAVVLTFYREEPPESALPRPNDAQAGTQDLPTSVEDELAISSEEAETLLLQPEETKKVVEGVRNLPPSPSEHRTEAPSETTPPPSPPPAAKTSSKAGDPLAHLVHDDTTTTRVFVRRPPPPPPRRDLPVPGVVLLVVVAVCVGILLGYVDTWLGTQPDPDGAASSKGASPEADDADLLTPVALDDAETTRRLIFRLCLDRWSRSPTREEVRELVGLRIDELWLRVDSKVVSPKPLTLADLPGHFAQLMGREPEPGEVDELLRLARNDPRYFVFHLTTSRAYAAPTTRKPKSEGQMARSLHVDFLDKNPDDQTFETIVAALKDPDGGLEQVVDLLLESSGVGPVGAIPPTTWCRDAFARFLLRFPTDEEQAAAIQQVAASPNGWKQVLRGLALRPRYREY